MTWRGISRWPRGNRRTVRRARPRRIQVAAFERRGVGPRAWNTTKSVHGKIDGCVVASAHAELQQRGRFKIGHINVPACIVRPGPRDAGECCKRRPGFCDCQCNVKPPCRRIPLTSALPGFRASTAVHRILSWCRAAVACHTWRRHAQTSNQLTMVGTFKRCPSAFLTSVP
jgi:hypothetical protein